MKGVREDGFDAQEAEQDEPGFLKRMIGARDKLKLGPHHKMERFTIMTGAAMLCMLLFTVMAFASHRSDVANLESSQAMFTDAFTYSLSGQSGELRGVYGNEARTDVMVLFEMTDPSAMSANAENYELFVTKDGRNSLDEANAPSVDFALFGPTGYGIVRFQSQTGEPIKSEALNVTIRSNETLASDGEGAVDTGDGTVDESFNEFDQAQMIVNPGSVNVEVLEGFEAGETDPSELYIPLVAKAEEADILERIEETTAEMHTLYNRSDEYLGRVESAGFVPPEEPWYIAKDSFTDDGEYVPGERVARSHDFDYTEHSIRDGYLNQVMNGLSEYEAYMAARSEAEQDPVEQAAESERETVPMVDTLKKSDGSSVNLDTIVTGSSSATSVAAKDATESLLSTWRDYLSSKQELERTLMGELLILDAEVRSQAELYTENEDAAIFY